MLEVANLIAVVGGDTTAHEVRQRARCHNCGVGGVTTRIRSSTRVTQVVGDYAPLMLRWMGLGLGQPI
jgi:hypothetical protein